MTVRPTRRPLRALAAAAVAVPLALAGPAYADARPSHHTPPGAGAMNRVQAFADRSLHPRTRFTMEADGSSGSRPDGAGIPNVDSVKSTIRTYYRADATGVADKTSSPYITEMSGILDRQKAALNHLYDRSVRSGKKPAIVLDADDTTLWTYDMEDHDMHFTFDPALQDRWVQDQRFPATPGMVSFVAAAQQRGFTVFGLTGRNDDQKAATLGNLAKVGYSGFTPDRFFTKWTGKGSSQQPSYISCAASKCTTVEYKAGTRKHIESLGYDIALNVGDQWSDLQGGYADHTLKLPNPTYYLPSPNLPGVDEPRLTPRTRFVMKPDGSSGLTAGGEGIPNVDSVKSTIRTYYNADATGIASRTASPYITELARTTGRISPALDAACAVGKRAGVKPAVVLDADDTTLWTYDMEDHDMHFTFDPALQDRWVQDQRFPATPGMVALVNGAERAGCTVIGLTGRNDDQKAATVGNLAKVGYTGFAADRYYTKWTGKGASQQPAYITCAAAKCTTTEYKSQTRAHVESPAGGGYTVVANLGDQFSDLIGGHALAPVKLPNPTYYLP
ncbi:HAD family acid phosphatase [Luteipulveratus sp. YIM 133132]|uniref:HAD family acid phosphatase n=1 Tax=Luteipulveratus flavus TaxID=3031728 RepID=UPI0023B1BABA|nr:HAD family acid phosphatase [Luteipulveratus sp. YIM 133132]MDE9366642.1 HAD family acid phosphatase [Luteipulveratus sp. YIM 133132]